MDGDARLAKVDPVAVGLIDAVRERDKWWIAAVCRKVAAGQVDVDALIVCLAAKAASRG